MKIKNKNKIKKDAHTGEIIIGKKKREKPFSPQPYGVVQLRAQESWANTDELPGFNVTPPHPSLFPSTAGSLRSP